MKSEKIYLGADHAGFKLKEEVRRFLQLKKIPFVDFGTDSADPVDYPDYAKKVARAVIKDKKSKGILICGTGTGMAMAANRIKGARAVAVYDNYSAKMSRLDNDANILCLRARQFRSEKAKKILDIWLKTDFSKKQRHKRRIRKLDK